MNEETKRKCEESKKLENEENEILSKEITIKELNKAINKLKNLKTGGKDLIVNEYLKKSGSNFREILRKHFNIILETGKIPKSWSKDIFLIFKIFYNFN